MTARGAEDAARRLRELKHEEWSDLVLAALALGLALGATAVHPPLAVPLFIGALAVGSLSLRAFFRRWELFDRILLDPDAHCIPEIHRRAEVAASMKSRQELARSLRRKLTPVPGYPIRARVVEVSDDLVELAGELDDKRLALDPLCAIRCVQLVTDTVESPLLNELLPPEDLRARINQIRAGFEQRRLAA
jgi:hypothetical protein